jgi:hypothetical protein
MSIYLKKFLFTALVFMMPYMNSISKAMDADDYEGSAVRVHKANFVTEDQHDVLSSVGQSASFNIEELENSQDSLVSYLFFPVKYTIQVANEFTSLATRNPKLAMMVGMCYMIPAIEACMCNCRFSYWVSNQRQYVVKPIGDSANLIECGNACGLAGASLAGCN